MIFINFVLKTFLLSDFCICSVSEGMCRNRDDVNYKKLETITEEPSIKEYNDFVKGMSHEERKLYRSNRPKALKFYKHNCFEEIDDYPQSPLYIYHRDISTLTFSPDPKMSFHTSFRFDGDEYKEGFYFSKILLLLLNTNLGYFPFEKIYKKNLDLRDIVMMKNPIKMPKVDIDQINALAEPEFCESIFYDLKSLESILRKLMGSFCFLPDLVEFILNHKIYFGLTCYSYLDANKIYEFYEKKMYQETLTEYIVKDVFNCRNFFFEHIKDPNLYNKYQEAICMDTKLSVFFFELVKKNINFSKIMNNLKTNFDKYKNKIGEIIYN
ncbi:hypothetical protein NGRA_1099 [Nosema granulosis]|uniref:Uncharacterized protein n=1 Tax=Nosema granulosis TaxID=83296 RepID=A0A9P6GZ15_9MICR|nr:hypothetical protein NGRA_1099 [Nosema granulosis]